MGSQYNDWKRRKISGVMETDPNNPKSHQFKIFYFKKKS
jgi:hypothetical protein